jgi:uncharacterized membrane protein
MATLPVSVSVPSLTAKPASQRAYRLDAIDFLRGLVIVIMAIDHTRDFFLFGHVQDPTKDPHVTVALFATRWITHFCAPVFVILAGVSAGLMTARRTPNQLTQFLFTRGLWLIFVEVFIVATAVTFSPLGLAHAGGLIFVPMQVIWAIGASMVALSALQRLGRKACLALGVAIVAGHNLLDLVWPASRLQDQQWPAWVALHSQMSLHVGPFLFLFIYPLLAWVGVMSLGFGISVVFELPADRRNVLLLWAGLAITAGFVVLRAVGIYGDPNPWHIHPGVLTATVISFLNTTKYPPSLLFLMMTLGPSAVLCSRADRITGVVKNVLVMYGRVPFAFYVAHFYLIHLLSMLLGVLQGFHAGQMKTIFLYFPQGYGLRLPGVYAVWALVVVLLYPFCRYVAGVKARRRDWWLSYV